MVVGGRRGHPPKGGKPVPMRSAHKNDERPPCRSRRFLAVTGRDRSAIKRFISHVWNKGIY
ncbi:hypothetical protein Stsp01_08680 [Streptomyces sp. NBRC 13847]|nr:hypothetical protein Stsp01_08680 [Streptomyces sp. NBRC 13847]